VTPTERRALRERYQFRCGYCGVQESEVGAELTADHFQPRSKGGPDEADNLVYCCHACNEFKGEYWQPDSPRRLLHPHRDTPSQHLALTEDGSRY
jgi:5-methylcytosine-specific restriction endonuclease McrA